MRVFALLLPLVLSVAAAPTPAPVLGPSDLSARDKLFSNDIALELTSVNKRDAIFQNHIHQEVDPIERDLDTRCRGKRDNDIIQQEVAPEIDEHDSELDARCGRKKRDTLFQNHIHQEVVPELEIQTTLFKHNVHQHVSPAESEKREFAGRDVSFHQIEKKSEDVEAREARDIVF